MTKNLISVLVVDDHPIVRRGLIAEINMNQDMRVIGEAKNGLEAIDMAERLNPNVILMDIVMPEMDGISATKTILASHPAIKILILTSFTDEEQIFSAITSGAHGFIYKDQHPDKVLDAIKGYCNGNPGIERKYYQKNDARNSKSGGKRI